MTVQGDRSEPAIEVRSVTKRYGDFEALCGVSLSIAQGEFFGLLGPNGAGKTTLISVIAGLSHASSGSASVMGHDVVTGFRAARRALGVVPQELVFDPFFTVRETLRITSGYYGVRGNDAWIDEILENLDLTSKADENMRALSGGMKRRVLVAQALVHRPPVIVLDEPTAGVDVELRQALWKFVRRLNRDGHTIVLTTHYLEEAEELCGRIAMLKHGSIVALDRTDTLLQRYSHARLRLKLSGAPLPPQLARLRWAAPAGDDQDANREGERDGRGSQQGDADRQPMTPANEETLRIDRYADVEPVLARLREAGCVIEDMELQRADLEEVFVRLMRETR